MSVNTATAIALADKAAALNAAFEGLTARQMLSRLLHGGVAGRVAVVSSFGAEAACLLSLVAEKDPATPVVFLDTRKHFDETLTYVDDLMDRLGMTTLVRARPSLARLQGDDPDGMLHASDPDRCCFLRKTLPMVSVLRHYDCILTGRKRFQTDDRAEMELVDVQESWLRANPLADWNREDVLEHLATHDILEHPLVAQGYASIGCEPCTQPSEDFRAGRWAGSDKTECGIHITQDGKVVRKTETGGEDGGG
jgi:phosphoadenosine phosphosulfate reductase